MSSPRFSSLLEPAAETTPETEEATPSPQVGRQEVAPYEVDLYPDPELDQKISSSPDPWFEPAAETIPETREDRRRSGDVARYIPTHEMLSFLTPKILKTLKNYQDRETIEVLYGYELEQLRQRQLHQQQLRQQQLRRQQGQPRTEQDRHDDIMEQDAREYRQIEEPERWHGPPLCEEQQNLVDLICSGRNVFYTGSAGCGKSTVLKAFVGRLRAQGAIVKIVAPTGRAALVSNHLKMRGTELILISCNRISTAPLHGRLPDGLQTATRNLSKNC